MQRTVEVSAVPLVAKARVPVNEAVAEIVWLFMVLEVAIVVIPERAPSVEALKAVDAMEKVSKAEPMAIVSAVVLFVPIFMPLPDVPVPILIVPVVPESKVSAFVVADLMVRAPESAMLFVVKV